MNSMQLEQHDLMILQFVDFHSSKKELEIEQQMQKNTLKFPIIN